MQNGLIVMLVGMLGVFLVLILFYVMIRILTKAFPYKPDDQ